MCVYSHCLSVVQAESTGSFRWYQALKIFFPFIVYVSCSQLHSIIVTILHTHTHFRMYVSSRPLFQELNTLMAYLGAPTYRRKRSLANAHSTIIGSQLEEFLDSMANECDEKTLRNLKAKEIFYQVRRRQKEGGRERERERGGEGEF